MKAVGRNRDTTQRREGKMQPWELTYTEIRQACRNADKNQTNNSLQDHRAIATAAGQKATDYWQARIAEAVVEATAIGVNRGKVEGRAQMGRDSG